MLKVLILLVVFRGELVDSCRNPLRSAGDDAANKIKEGMEKATLNLQNSMAASTTTITTSINSAVSRLEVLGKSVTSELGQTIRQASSDLVRVSEKVTATIDKGVVEMSGVLKEAISTTQEIADKLLASADKAVEKAESQIENAVDAVREISSDLTNSIDKGMKELGSTLRHVADKMAEAAKQIKVDIDTNHLVGVANTTGEALVRSVQELTTNWELAVNTADFKDLGVGAAAELSAALQNLRGYFEVHIGINRELKEAILYISVAICIAFSVCFVAMIIALKSCRSCTAKLFMLMLEKCKSGSSSDDDEENVDTSRNQPVVKNRDCKRRPKLNNLNETETPLKKLNNKITSDYDSDSDSLNDSDGNIKKNGSFSKRRTMSLADFDEDAFSAVRNKWVRRETKNVRRNGNNSSNKVRLQRMFD